MKYVVDFGPTTAGTAVFNVFRNLNSGEDLIGVAPALTPITDGWASFDWASGIVVQFRVMISGNTSLFIPGIIDQTDASPSVGEGSLRVDHNYGGTDNLRILDTDTSAPIDNAYVYAYLAVDYDNGRYDIPTYLKGFTITAVDGRWTEALWLDPGVYRLLIKAPLHQPKVIALTVV